MGLITATGKRQALGTLAITRLRELVDRFELQVVDRRAKDDLVSPRGAVTFDDARATDSLGVVPGCASRGHEWP